MLPLAVVILIPWFVNGVPVTKVPQNTQPPQPNPEILTEVGCTGLDGKWYPAGSEVSRGSDGNGWCYGTYCSHDGNLIAWDDWNCKTTTTGPVSSSSIPPPTSTSNPTTSPTPYSTTVPPPLGCFQNGAWYEPGSEISRASNGEGWCHGISCDAKGKIVAWDDWNCEDTDENPESTTKVDKGCYYKKKWHPQGSIFEGSDSNGCRYGVICGDDGQVQCDGMNLTVIPSRRIESHKLLPLTISLAIW